MILYAESSAVLAWLLMESEGPRVESLLAAAERTIASDLTLLECDRAVHRAVALGRVSPAMGDQLASDLTSTAASWRVVQILPTIVARARKRFPHEPIRSLDALHVTSALHARAANPDVVLLSLDDRIRRVAASVGLELVPA
ncbi:MAG TPA: type II toxin-antitoxin system VapC family toxin [Rhizomicrobium sp.]|nr:type II toxin-antitoxin system VapC family toxin [Rhizomicrobium sp.]